MRKSAFIMALPLLGLMASCGGSSDSTSEQAVAEGVAEESPSDKIEKALDMEDFDEANNQIEKLIGNNIQDLALFEKVWKREARYLIKRNDDASFIDLITLMSLYNITEAPRPNAIVGQERSYIMGNSGREIVEQNESFNEEVYRFNSIVDDLVDICLLHNNHQLANKCLVLYRDNLQKHQKPHPNPTSETDRIIYWWTWATDSKDAAKKRIQEAK